jgi:hypothetical protein
MFLSSSKPRSLKPRAARYEWMRRAMTSYDEARSDESSLGGCVGRASAMPFRMAATLRGSDMMKCDGFDAFFDDVVDEWSLSRCSSSLKIVEKMEVMS